MRVTNNMIYGNSMNNIWRNARHVNNLVTQQETGVRIQLPSEDPLIAARAMRYRTVMAEAEQFLRNVHQGTAWMEISESAFNNILTGDPTNPSMMQQIYENLVRGAQTGTQRLEHHRAILSDMQQSFNQMFSVDLNQTYLGRYVFSGFHTDQPPVLKQNWSDRSFVIRQDFLPRDIERARVLHRENPTDMPTDTWTNIIKLPFTNVNFADHGVADVPLPRITLADGTEFVIREFNSIDPDAYSPEDFYDGYPVIHHLRDTGELVVSDAVRNLIRDAGGLSVTYEKTGFRTGELNPMIFFESSEITGGQVTHFNAAAQSIQMEISPSSYITVNSHARNILSANLFSDLRRLFEFADSLVTSDPNLIREYYLLQGLTGDYLDNAVANFLANEEARFSSAIHTRFNNLLESFQWHQAGVQREHTALGTRMARMDMVAVRLEEDQIAYTDLLSETIDVDLIEVMRRRDAAEIAFGHALRAIAITAQLSLADFINR